MSPRKAILVRTWRGFIEGGGNTEVHPLRRTLVLMVAVACWCLSITHSGAQGTIGCITGPYDVGTKYDSGTHPGTAADHFEGACIDGLHRSAKAAGFSICGLPGVASTALASPSNYHFEWAIQNVFGGGKVTLTWCDARMEVNCNCAPPPPDPDQRCWDGTACTPIVLDMEGDNFAFTDRAGGVFFDLDADGVQEAISWTAAGSGDVFLVLDRNGNGTIDNGQELFGDATPQPASSSPDGYKALAVHDDNGDGIISSSDPVYRDLRLWRDISHDGLSQPEELTGLAEAEVAAVSLDFKESRRRDRHGNLLRYKSWVAVGGRQVWSVDVFLTAE